MCNLYNITTTQAAIVAFTRALRDLSGNLEPSLDIYPDYLAPVVRNGPDGQRELVRMRWGLGAVPANKKADVRACGDTRKVYIHIHRRGGIGPLQEVTET